MGNNFIFLLKPLPIHALEIIINSLLKQLRDYCRMLHNVIFSYEQFDAIVGKSSNFKGLRMPGVDLEHNLFQSYPNQSTIANQKVMRFAL